IITLLQSRCFIDTYRHNHLFTKNYTYTRPSSEYSSRIDFIWTSPTLTQHIIDTIHIPITTIINSDHKMVTLYMNTPHTLWSKPVNRKNSTQREIDYSNSKDKQ